MSKLIVFGDSFTQGHNLDYTFPPYKEWKAFRGGELPHTWVEILSEKLNKVCLNYAVGGASNIEIMNQITKHSDEFKKGDVVIINWSYMNRFRWGGEYYDGTPIWKRTSLVIDPSAENFIDEKTRIDIALNRSTNPLYLEEIYDFEKLLIVLAKAMEFKIFFWSATNELYQDSNKIDFNKYHYMLSNLFEKNDETIFDIILRNNGKKIEQETNYVVRDGHLGESGHSVQAQLFYDFITTPYVEPKIPPSQ